MILVDFTLYADKKGLIIDEIQEVPELLSYMQGIIDAQLFITVMKI